MKKRALCPLSGVHFTIKPIFHYSIINTSKGDTVLLKCVSSKVLIFVVNSKIKSRTMKLTTEQRSEIISEMGSSEAGFNELMCVLLDSFPSRSGLSFSKNIKENRATVSVLVVGVDTVAVFDFASRALARVLFNRSYSASWLLRKASVHCFFMSCMRVDFPVKTSPRWVVASTVTTTADSR